MAAAEGTQNAEVATEEYVNTVADKTAGAAVKRYFTIPGRDAFIAGKDKPTFEQKGVEFPKFWSQTATNIVAQKYFRGRMSSPEREKSVKQMIGRIVTTVGTWGREGGYFADEEEAGTFEAELKAILVNQLAAFNSPVWFNVGFEEKPQCSACFILSIDDSMESILDWIRREGIIFRGGSGSGVNLSRLRSSKEQLSKGGYASGPVSFMRGADASAGTIKSGGKTRRAANLTARTDGTVIETLDARKLLRDIAEAAWRCADPGVQYDTTINAWHTLPNTGRINASNPCCFTGDTLVDTEEGFLRFDELFDRKA